MSARGTPQRAVGLGPGPPPPLPHYLLFSSRSYPLPPPFSSPTPCVLAFFARRPAAPRSSQPQPIIPTEAPGRTYNTTYFTRDVRRNADASANVPVEASFSPEGQLLLPRVRLVDKPEAGSPGAKNPDVFRYDPSGARSAMTANWAALERGLAAARPTQLPAPVWARHPTGASLAVQERLDAQGTFIGTPKDRRRRGWAYSMVNDA